MTLTGNYPLPFGIDFVVNLDLPDAKRYKASGAGQYNIECPNCGRPKLNINETRNQCRCPACGQVYGGPYDLHRFVKGFSTKDEAKKDLWAEWKKLNPDQRKLVKTNMTSLQQSKSAEVADEMILNTIYNKLYAVMTSNGNDPLADIDRQDLHCRGLKDEDIARLKIMTYPKLGEYTIPKMLFNSMGAGVYDYYVDMIISGKGIPGFYVNYHNGKKSIRMVKLEDGYLIPVMNRCGQLVRFQIRNRNAEKGKKYTSYSSQWKNDPEKGWYGGCSPSGLTSVHYVGFDFTSCKTPDTVFLTEGCLKADVASVLMGNKPFLGLLGVGNHKGLLHRVDPNGNTYRYDEEGCEYPLDGELIYLRDHGTKEIHICVDMDMYENPNVAHACKTILKMVETAGLKVVLRKWDKSSKGIDDFLLAQWQKKGLL